MIEAGLTSLYMWASGFPEPFVEDAFLSLMYVFWQLDWIAVAYICVVMFGSLFYSIGFHVSFGVCTIFAFITLVLMSGSLECQSV